MASTIILPSAASAKPVTVQRNASLSCVAHRGPAPSAETGGISYGASHPIAVTALQVFVEMPALENPSQGHCHSDALALVQTGPVAFAYGRALIPPPPLSERRDPAGHLALFPLHSELPRRRGHARRARYRRVLRNGPPLALEFDAIIARKLRRGRPRPDVRWHLDEVFVSMNGRQLYVWRAVDSEGEVLDMLVQPRRDRKAARKLMRKTPEEAGRPSSHHRDRQAPSRRHGGGCRCRTRVRLADRSGAPPCRSPRSAHSRRLRGELP